jgi:hypothetical protein
MNDLTKQVNKKIGFASVQAPENIREWVEKGGAEWWSKVAYPHLEVFFGTENFFNWRPEWVEEQLQVKFFWYKSWSEEKRWNGESSFKKYSFEEFNELLDYSVGTDFPFDCYYSDEIVSIISFGGNAERYILPTKFLHIKFLPDYSSLKISEIKKLRSVDSVLDTPLDYNLAPLEGETQQELEDKKKLVQEEIKGKQQELEDIKKMKTPELAEMEAQIEQMRRKMLEKKDELLASVNKKRFELEAKVEEMKTQIFYLETDINAILGYLGENIKFLQLRKGKNSSVKTPIVLYQKLRYLDDELGKYLAFSDFNGEDYEKLQFEKVLANRPDLVDMFIPSEKGIAMFKNSKTGKGYAMGTGAYGNLLKDYKKIHGTQLSILVKNGENLYITWLDEKDIVFTEDMFLETKTEVQNNETNTIAFKWENSREVEEQFDKVKKEQRRVRKEFSSRYILFSILQGVLDNMALLEIPERVNVLQAVSSKQSPYIVLSVAEGWLEDNRFPDFRTIIDKYSRYGRSCDEEVAESEFVENMKPKKSFHQVGDDLYILHRLTGWSPQSTGHSYFNSDNRSNRSNEWRNTDLTQDVKIKKGMSKMNLILVNDGGNEWRRSSWTRNNGEHYMCREMSYFVRGEKTDKWDWNESKRGANFRVYTDEFINLTFLNSLFIENVIRTQNIGNLEGNFASIVPDLHIMLSFLRNREQEELSMIKKIIPDFDTREWQLLLSDWKLEHGVHKITEFQAKRFVKSLKMM